MINSYFIFYIWCLLVLKNWEEKVIMNESEYYKEVIIYFSN